MNSNWGIDSLNLEYSKLEHRSINVYTHPAGQCANEICAFHNRSNHSLRSFPQSWNNHLKIMERVCTHGVGHPDPDDTKFITSEIEGIHKCDGCCLEYQENFDDSLIIEEQASEKFCNHLVGIDENNNVLDLDSPGYFLCKQFDYCPYCGVEL